MEQDGNVARMATGVLPVVTTHWVGPADPVSGHVRAQLDAEADG
jgi:hypothetical protein